MPDIKPPSRPADHPDRGLDCEEALEPTLVALVDAAVAAGWTEDEVATALISWAQANRMALGANWKTDEAVRKAQRRQ